MSFWRNSFVSLASVFVMTMTLMIIGSLMFLNSVVAEFVTYVEDKVDVNVYFVVDASESDFVPEADEAAIADLAEAVQKLPEVAFVTFPSRDEALAVFRQNHENDQLTLQALDELGENPFGASLAVKAKDPSQYAGIAGFLNDRMQDAPLPLIDSVNYAENKIVIDRLQEMTRYAERFGYLIIILFAAASVLITFNTVRLAIYTEKEEIGVMRLVGASNMYVRGPFIVEGTLYGAVSGLIALLLFIPLTLAARGATMAAFGADIFALYIGQLWLFIIVLVGAGALLGAVSSFLAVRKYLSV